MTDALRGHSIEQKNGEWVYSDTKEPTAENWEKRPCGYCGKENTPEGHDGCLGTLSGVMNACCGHGKSEDAYVQFENETIIRGTKAMTLQSLYNALKDPTKTVELCVRNSEGKKEWFQVDEIDESLPIEDYRVGGRIYEVEKQP